ncbi:HdeD family acid-resistance protein [Chitinophaga solisilvae]|uniref:HdeD family acid-resistance protein n=1 Tax=Chitinophaga solisilvae TaxID=1233460 RepID=A0A9Q5DAR4_9BACT|nr:HdeD family acid-resistance protein [Chitinophaga solisilvae]NSL89710.1 HdeD family acid-resistance protein [Chitinophaga solisilvae]
MHNFYSAYWWIFLLRGLFALIIGLVAIFWPGAAFTTLVVFLGAYLFAGGLFAVIGAVAARRTTENWGLFLLSGLTGIILGILTLYNPFATGNAIIYLIAVWAMLAGIFEIIIAIRLRTVITGEGWYIVGGLLTIIFGILLLSNPQIAALTLTWVFGLYAVISGIMLIALSFRLRSR